MTSIPRHVTRCLVAGIVALLPVGGTAVALVYLEGSIAGSWLREQAFYFPGLGLLALLVAVYLLGLWTTTVLGRWLWRRLDRLLETLPALGTLYQTLKQILGYGRGRDALFQRVVLVPADGGFELGLVTQDLPVGCASVAEAPARCVVFVPSAPNPTSGRLVVATASDLQPVRMRVADALKALVSVGKADMAV